MCTLAHIISQVSLLLCQQGGGCPHWLRHVLQIQCLPFDNLGSTHSRRSRRTRSRALMPTSSRESGMLSSCASSSVHICVAGHYTSSYPWHDFSQLNHPIFFQKKRHLSVIHVNILLQLSLKFRRNAAAGFPRYE